MSVVGTVSHLVGRAVAIKADGTERLLSLGDQIFADEVVRLAPDATIEISTESGELVQLDGGQSWLASSETYNTTETFDNSEATTDIESIQAAILAGADPTEVGEATAAGGEAPAAGGQGNEGSNTVNITRTAEEVDPTAGYDTVGTTDTFTTPEEEPLVEPITELPEVSVSVEVEVEVGDPEDPQNPENPETPVSSYVTVTPEGVQVLEGTSEGVNSSSREVKFNLVLDKVFDQDVEVTYQFNVISENGAADYGLDWDNSGLVVTTIIPAGSTVVPVTITIDQDRIDEGDGVFELVLVDAVNATINPDASSETITIIDDDTTPDAVNDQNSLTDNGDIYSVSGNVLTNDTDEDGDDSNGLLEVAGAPVVVEHALGTLTIQQDGSYEFVLNEDGIDYIQSLDEGESGSINFSDAYQVTDGVNEGTTADVTITINGVEDGAVVTDDAKSVTEDDNNPTLSVNGQVTVSDADQGEDAFDTATLSFTGRTNSNAGDLDSTQLGTLTLLDDQGNYTFEVDNAAVQYLDAGETIVQTWTVASLDGSGTSTITITINGVEDGAVVTDDAKSVTEDDNNPTLSVNGQVTVSDADQGEDAFDTATLSFTGRTNSNAGDLDSTQLGTLTLLDDQGNYTFEVDNAAVQYLDAGETIVQTWTVASLDGSGTSTITITINGVEDGAVVTDDAKSVTEDDNNPTLSVNGQVTVSDADQGEDAFDTATLSFTGRTNSNAGDLDSTQLGTLTLLDDQGNYTFEVDNAAVQYLDAGETIVQTWTVASLDGSGTSTITITINGVEDGAVVTDDAKSVTEDDNNPTLSVNGQVTVSDADQGEDAFDTATLSFTGRTNSNAGDLDSTQLGTLTLLDDQGNYTFEVDNAAVQYLDAGETIVQTWTVASLDGSGTSTITITINGVEDGAVVTDDAKSVTEDDNNPTLSVNGQVTVSDADQGEDAFDTATLSFTGRTNSNAGDLDSTQLGTLTLLDDQGNYTFEVDNAAVQYLDAGETIVQTWTVASLDGSGTSTITITINGVEDGAVVTDDAKSVTEDDNNPTLSVNGQVTVSDADQGEDAFDTATLSFTGRTNSNAGDLDSTQLGTLTLLDDQGNYTFEVDNAAVQYLDAGETIVQTWTVASLDGSGTSTITITINGVEDGAVVTDDAKSVTEDDNNPTLSVNGQVTVSDADQGEDAFDTATLSFTGRTNSNAGDLDSTQLGTLTLLDDQGNYTFEVDNAAVQYLDAGETIVQTWTVASLDGSGTSTITITINGVEDGAVVTDDAKSVTEDDNNPTLSVNGQVTVSDADQGEDAFDTATLSFTGRTNSNAGDLDSTQLGTLTLLDDQGNYTFEVDNAAVQYLDAGETIVQTWTVASLDGSGTSTITITINGVEDGAVVTDDAKSVTEDDNNPTLSVNGQVTVSDADQGEDAFDTATLSFTGRTNSNAGDLDSTQLGTLTLLDDQGNYTFEVDNAAVQYLDAGETIVQTWTVASLDGSGTSTITITINGVEDGAVVTDDAKSVTEDDNNPTLSVNGQVTVSDADQGEDAFDTATLSFTGRTNSNAGDLDSTQLGTLTLLDDQGNYTFEVDNAAVQYLDAGETIVQTWTVASLDGSGTSTITITINGVEDGAVVTDDAKSVTEDDNNPTLSVNGQVTVSDADQGEDAFDTATLSFTGRTNSNAGDLDSTQLGTLTLLDDQGNYTFEVDNAAVQYLDAGETIVQTWTVASLDGSGTSTITITINGVEDGAVVTDDAKSVTEDDNNPTLSVNGQVTVSDADQGEDAFDTATLSFTGRTNSNAGDLDSTQLGTLTLLDDQGNYTFEVDNAAVQYLDAGETIVQTWTVASLDGSGTSTITITINGVEDGAVVTDDAKSVTEDDNNPTLSVNGQVTVSDADQGEDAFDTATLSFTGRTNSNAGDLDSTQLGTLTLLDDQGNYTFEVDNAAVQYLDAGETIVQTWTVASLDGSGTSTITITINGVEDGAVVTDDAKSVTEDDNNPTLSVNGQVTVSDADQGEDAFDTATLSFTGRTNSNAGDLDSTQLGTLTLLDDQGNYTFEVDNAAVQYLDAGETIVQTWTVASLDGSGTSTITITINGVEDGAVVTDDAKSVTEDDNNPTLSVNGQVTVSDADQGEDAFDTATLSFTGRTNSNAGDLDSTQLGTLTLLDDQGNYTFEVDNAAVQYLDAGETIVQTWTVASLDGSGTSTITITINGVNDGPTIQATAAPSTVYEAGLAAGSDADSDSEVTTGSFAFADSDGLDDIETLTVGGTTYTRGVDFTDFSDLVGSSVDVGYGTVQLTAYNDGEFSYTYTLDEAVNNSTQAGATDAGYTESFDVSVSDGTSSDSITVDVNVVDDVPAFTLVNDGNQDGTVSISAGNADATYTGVQFADWVYGADGAGSFNLVDNTGADGTVSINNALSDSDSIVIDMTDSDGQLVAQMTLNADGTDSLETFSRENDTQTVSLLTGSVSASGPDLVKYINDASGLNVTITGSDGDAIYNESDDEVNPSTQGWAISDNQVDGGESITFSFNQLVTNFSFVADGFTGKPSGGKVGLNITVAYSDGTSETFFTEAASGQVINVDQLSGFGTANTDSFGAITIESDAASQDHNDGFRLNNVNVTTTSSTAPDDIDFDFTLSNVSDGDGDVADQDFLVSLSGQPGGLEVEAMVGTSGNDILTGTADDEIFIGGAGNDTLTGGAGADLFIFNAEDLGVAGAPAADQIVDFNAAEGDVIDLADVLADGNSIQGIDNGGHLQIQVLDTDANVVQTIDVDSVGITTDAADALNSLLSSGAIDDGV
ncbi:retention module-containing protein [Neptuniibacter halophilus]|uniref:retention module-containing protein n=1 Tax=Neptuniibacter halophilus TaxID=651666 RepID=UPI002573059E|nr:retention module-containing protein [Neptuniibacter halophilus]